MQRLKSVLQYALHCCALESGCLVWAFALDKDRALANTTISPNATVKLAATATLWRMKIEGDMTGTCALGMGCHRATAMTLAETLVA
jgi:hypothetical protein